MSDRNVVDYLMRDDDKERETMLYVFLGFIAFLLLKFALEYMMAEKQMQMKRNQLRFAETRLSQISRSNMSKMSNMINNRNTRNE